MAAVEDGHTFDTPYNVVAGFRSRSQAESAARRLSGAGLRASVEFGAGPDPSGPVETAELRAEMQEESGDNWAPATGRQTRGALLGIATFAAVGLVVGLIGGFLANVGFGIDMALAGTMAIGAVAGATGGATVGLVAGGGMAPRLGGSGQPALDDPAPAAERDVLLAVHASDPEVAQRAAEILRAEEAERVDLVGADGAPLSSAPGRVTSGPDR